MLNLTCHCGQIQVTIQKRPDFINECNCSVCCKAGAQWGYFHPSEVTVERPANGYRREDKGEPGAQFNFCPNCGSTTHFTLTEAAAAKFGNSVMGVNMRLADEPDLAGIELRYPDGRSWPGHGEVGYLRPARVIGSG